ncbi:hypothetical protein KIPB_016525, partial [Kipferlia bialata]|eukprot:g16525.t1
MLAALPIDTQVYGKWLSFMP